MKAADINAKADNAKTVNSLIAAGKDVKRGAGDGLFFRLRDKRTGWHLLYTSPTTGKRRECPIAWAPSDPVLKRDVDAVRAAAAELRRQVAAGIDPLDAKTAVKAAKVGPVTFADAARAYLKVNDSWTPKQEAWVTRRLLGPDALPSKITRDPGKDYLKPIRDVPVDDLTAAIIVEQVLLEFWAAAPVAAGRMAQIICAVLDRPGLAREIKKKRPQSAMLSRQKWTGGTREVVKVEDKDRHHPAAPWQSLPTIWAKLMVEGSLPALAAAFALATAQRAGSVAGAEWQEIDLDAKVWTIPAARMKGRAGKRDDHAVPLNAAALDVLNRLATTEGVVFPSPAGARHVGTDSMREALQRAAGAEFTLHGTGRASFGSWVTQNAPGHIETVDPILAHRLPKTSRAYRRDVPVEAMRPVLDAYGRFLLTGALPAASRDT